jgi:hypothetical protein
MILSLIGAVDLRGFIGIDELPFKTSPVFSAILSGKGTALNTPDSGAQEFLGKIGSALGCDWQHLVVMKESVPFPIFPLFGDAVAFRIPKNGVLVKSLRETACALIQSGEWGIYTYIDIKPLEEENVEDESVKARGRIPFDPSRCVSILNNSEMSMELWVSSPGLITLQIDIDSSDPDFVTYWYPCVSAIETSTYHLESLEDQYLEDQYDGNNDQAAALAQVPHAGSFNRSMRDFRVALCDHLRPQTRLEYPARQIDELETGLYSVLRLSSTENCRVAIKSATAHNENTQLSKIESDPYTTFVGWTAACITVKLDDKADGLIGDSDEKAIYNLRLFTIYSSFTNVILELYLLSTYLDKTKHSRKRYLVYIRELAFLFTTLEICIVPRNMDLIEDCLMNG